MQDRDNDVEPHDPPAVASRHCNQLSLILEY